MPDEHEEYDNDTNLSEQDCDIIIEQRRVSVHVDPFLPADDGEAQPRKPKLVESLLKRSVWKKCATKPQEPPLRRLAGMC